MKPKTIAQSMSLLVFTALCLTASTSWARPPRAQELCGALQVVDRQTHLLTLLTAGNETPLRLAWKTDTSLVRNGQFDTAETLKAGGEVTIAGFGAFSAKQRAGRTGVNPQNPSQKIQIPPVVVPKFKAGKALKDALKGKK